jgi:hypothetical protein
LGVFRRGEPGYLLQVLALPSSGCGLSTSIPHASTKFQNNIHFRLIYCNKKNTILAIANNFKKALQ